MTSVACSRLECGDQSWADGRLRDSDTRWDRLVETARETPETTRGVHLTDICLVNKTG
jgi:hypothetical protein